MSNKATPRDTSGTEGQPAIEYHIVPPNELIAENAKLRAIGSKLYAGAWDRTGSWWETDEGQAAFEEWDALMKTKDTPNDEAQATPE